VKNQISRSYAGTMRIWVSAHGLIPPAGIDGIRAIFHVATSHSPGTRAWTELARRGTYIARDLKVGLYQLHLYMMSILHI